MPRMLISVLWFSYDLCLQKKGTYVDSKHGREQSRNTTHTHINRYMACAHMGTLSQVI